MSQLNFKNGNIESGKKSFSNRYMQRDTPSFQRKKMESAFFSLESRINVDFFAQLRFSFIRSFSLV